MNFKLALGLCLVLCQLELYCAQTCPQLESNIDYFGGDITYSITTSVLLCCSKCASFPGCTSFSYVAAANVCWLKNLTQTNVNRVSTSGRILKLNDYLFEQIL